MPAKKRAKAKPRQVARRTTSRVHVKAATATQWSQKVTRNSDAMDLEAGVFTLRSAAAIAGSLKQSVEKSKRRKSPPFQSAMSMLNFEINRAGKAMPEARRRRLNAAKAELRRLFHRDESASTAAASRKRKTRASPQIC